MGFYSKFEKYLNNICYKNNFSTSVFALLSACFFGVMLVTSILPTVLGAVIGGTSGIIGAFIYCFFISQRRKKQK